jgi:hypothetical protein
MNKCERCGEEVEWGKNGCPHISEKEYADGKFGIMMGMLPPNATFVHYNENCAIDNQKTLCPKNS